MAKKKTALFKKTSLSRLVLIITIIFLCFPLIFVLMYQVFWPQDQSLLVFCDVGQGDASLFITRDFQMMIDTGPDENEALNCLKNYMPYLDKKLEILILTHPDQDHIGGALKVLQNYQPHLVITPPVYKNTKIFREVLEEINSNPVINVENYPDNKYLEIKNDISIIFYTAYPRTNLGYNPFKTEQKNNNFLTKSEGILSDNFDFNSLSIGTLLNIDQFLVWFGGDMGKEQELALINRGVLNKINMLKVGHHGAKTSSDFEFLSTLSPENAVISVGQKNNYGHPAIETLDNLKKINSQIFQTSTLGDIVFTIKKNHIITTSGNNLNIVRLFIKNLHTFNL